LSSNRPSHHGPLPRGRHKLGREFVRDSQRSRIVAAALDAVAERGYADTNVAHVVARARVSRNAFYALFEDKEAAFLAACEESGNARLEELYALREDRWYDAVRAGLEGYLRWWDENPGVTLAYLVDLPTAGRRAQEQRDRHLARWADMFVGLAARARREQPELPALPALAPRVLVAGITELLAQEARAGRARLVELQDDLLELVVKTLADERTAKRAARPRLGRRAA
jgi:AcrR family transcriptional regulator